MTTFGRGPKPETLQEFPVYAEILEATGRELIAAEEAIIALEQRDAARQGRRPKGRTPDQVGRGRSGMMG
jgi:hypothetical protein